MPSARRGYVGGAEGQLHYRLWGDASVQECWVLLHHSASDSRALVALGDQLARDNTVVAFDTPGFGMSDALDVFSVESAASAIREGLLNLGMTRWSVFGHHTGASIALSLAATDGGRLCYVVLSGLLLPGPGDRQRMAAPLAPLTVDIEGSHLASAWKRVRRYTPRASPATLTREAVALLSAHEPHVVYDAVLEYDARADLARVSSPVLVVCGADEHLAMSTAAAAALANRGSFELIHGAGLDMHETHAAQLATLMTSHATGGTA